MSARFEELVSRFLDDRLGADEERELLGLLEDAGLRRRFAELCRQDRELAGLLSGPIADDRMAEIVGKDLDRPRHESTRVLAVMAEIPEGRPSRRRRRPAGGGGGGLGAPAWVASIAAAAALLALVFAATRPPRAPVPRPPAEEARVQREPAPPPVPAPPPAARAAELPPTSPPPPALPPAPPPPVPAPRVPSPPLPPPPPPPPAVASAPAVAELGSVEGTVELDGAPARPGDPVRAGQGIRAGAASRAELAFPDGTRLELSPEAELRDLRSAGGKRALLAAGRLTARVARQPAGEPAVFRTAHAEALVLGTTLRLEAGAVGTRLEVTEGRVRIKRISDGRTLDVPAGHFAVAAPGTPFEIRPLPVDEIVLRAVDARRVGPEWRLVDDPEASGGKALEALTVAREFKVRTDKDREAVNEWYAKGMSRSYAVFTFQADAGRDYHVWVRGRSLDAGPERFLHDDVMLQVVGGRFAERPPDWFPYAETFCPIQGYGSQPGWWWSGGAHDPGKTQTPIVVRFARSGRQTLLMHASEPPMRVDAIRLSTTQKARPPADERR